MSAFLSAMLLVLRRSLANWKLLSSIVAGVLVAVTLVSSTPLFSNALSDLGLRHAISKRPIETLDMQVTVPSNPPLREEYVQMTGLLDSQVGAYLSGLVRQKERSLLGATFTLGKPGEPIPTGPARPTGYFYMYTNLEKHVRLVEGRLAEPSRELTPAEIYAQLGEPPPSGRREKVYMPDFAVEALIGAETARLGNLKPGDEVLFFSDLWGDGPTQIRIKLTGTVEPLDRADEFWFLNPDIFTVASEEAFIAPLFIPEQTYFGMVANVFPRGRASYHWYYYIDTDAITSLNAGYVEGTLRQVEQNIVSKIPRAGSFTNLGSVIREYQEKQLFTQIPLFLLVFQIVGIILYYVVTVANMVIEQETTEIALLRSRGANTLQVFGIFLMEGVLISAVGGILGPLLGAFIFGLLGKTAPFAPLSGGGLLPVRFSQMVFILAAAAALLCLVAFMLPALQAARRGIVQQRQQLARPPRTPFWQRYYLDVALLAAGAGLYYEIRQRGTLAQSNLFGDLGMDPLLLMTPLLFMIAVAIVFLRLFPLIVKLAEFISRYVAGSATLISLRYMARNPVHYGRLILLLVMAASVGTFAASFLGTLNRSYQERALYLVGADMRLEGLLDYTAGKKTLTDRFASVPGVDDVSVVLRENATIGTSFTSIDSDVLAMDPDSMSRIAWFREDFADRPFGELMAGLARDKPVEQGLLLPDGTERMGLWVKPAYTQPVRIRLVARIEDARNHYWDIEIGIPAGEDWQFLEAVLKVPGSANEILRSPLTLHNIYLSTSGGRTGDLQGLFLDDLQTRSAGQSDWVVIEDFDNVDEWTTQVDESLARSLSGSAQGSDSFRVDFTTVHDGRASARYIWAGRAGPNYRGLFPNLDLRPLSAVVSTRFAEASGTQVGSWLTVRLPGQYILVEVADIISYFPTLDPDAGPFMLVNLDRLLTLRNRQLGNSLPLYPNEIWLGLTEDREQRAAVTSLLGDDVHYRADRVYDSEKIIAEQRSDPLVAAGWGGVLTLAFFGVALVSGLGFIVYAYLSARGRQLEFAILRTLGFSFRQIISLIGFEQVFIIVMGMGIGTLAGIRLSSVMMPFLQLTERGERVIPPFAFVTDWATIGITYSVLGVAFVATISMVVLFFTRVALSRTLRMGDQ